VSAAELAPGATLATAICTRVRAEILSGIRRPRERIRLEELKAQFDVSWSPLREALSRLVAEGLVQTDESRGYRVAPVSRAEMSDIIRMRKALESMALRASVESGDDAWEAEVLATHHRLSKLEERRSRNEDLEEWEAWHRAYHHALVRACGSPLLLQFCTQLHDQFARYRKLFLASHAFDHRVHGEHKELTDAALARDAVRACSLMERHIERTGSNILACIQ
jgi:GntR family transcriptional regulator, carbon starvation induced regulator